MPTRVGWALGVAGVVVLITARVLGVDELFAIGAVLVVLPIAATIWVRSTHVRIEVGRDLHPQRVHAGGVVRVELRVANVGRQRTPILHVEDPVDGTAGAQLQIAPLAAGERARAAYRLPTSRRGVIGVGPLLVEVSDPLGLASITARAAGRLELTVYPRTDVISAVPDSGGRDPLAGAEHARSLGRQGDDFHSLREYVVGDDLRRVHWRSTARTGELMVRQDEMPWQGRTTLVLDVRRGAHAGTESFEAAISAAASVAEVCWRNRELVRLLASDGSDSGFGMGHAHTDAILEHLAAIEPAPNGSLRKVLDGLRTHAGGGALVVVLGRPVSADLDALAGMRRRFGSVIVVAIDADTAIATRPGIVMVTRPFAERWDAHFGRGAVPPSAQEATR